MKFTIAGVEYNTSVMQSFDTGDPSEPKVYIDQECRVFVMARRGQLEYVYRAATPEIRDLAGRHDLKPLLRAIR